MRFHHSLSLRSGFEDIPELIEKYEISMYLGKLYEFNKDVNKRVKVTDGILSF